MAEKTKTKKLESEKEAHEEPIADLAEKAIEDFPAEELTEVVLEKEIEKVLDTREQREKAEAARKLEAWVPKTKLGEEVRTKKIKNIDEILDSHRKILEEQIVDSLLKLKSDLISVGQSKGKFGGGKRRAWRQTQRKTKEGNIPSFSTTAVVGDEKGHVGIGTGKAKETLPARDKAIRNAKLGIIKVIRGCASFDCACTEKHSVPFKVEGKAGSVRVILIPAPQGTGLVAAGELKKVLKLAGVKDVYTKTFGQQRTSFNLVKACMNALNKTNVKENE
jgi:small subunit ribosomal protein S5